MGKRKAGFNYSKQRGKPSQKNQERKPYTEIIKENELFINYYKTQNICHDDEEFEELIKSLKTDLPATFRITGSKEEAKKMLNIVQAQFLEDCLNQNSGECLPNIFPLPWYPNKLAWQMNITRKDIRSNEAYYKLHNFLISETEHGTISRQETVSMIPPLVLDVQPHHKILDMCAAPGSKTAQLLELLHSKDDPIPSGYVVANDVDNKRCYMLVHQAKRLNSPCVAVINHDSAVLPNLSQSLPDGRSEQVLFDRILCDVPCSGDGTLRKNPDIWMKWTPANALNLHGIQFRIARRGAELLKVGGRMVYSTCSLNPIENESVIHRLLVETDGALKLVDASSLVPGLKFSPGKQNWLVGSRNLEFYKSFEEVDEKWQTTIRPQMFPPKPENLDKFDLHKCMRILPQQQNTGAFFVAVLEKVKPLSAKEKFFADIEKAQKKKLDEKLPENQRKRRRKEVFREDPFVFFNEEEPVWNEIKSFYNVEDKFDSKCLLTRCHVGKKKNIYLVSNGIRDLVISNQEKIKFINTGVKAFVRCDNKNMSCAFRIANDGLESIYPFIGDNRKINIPRDDLLTLLLNPDPMNSPPISKLSEEIKNQVSELSPGSCVLVYSEKESQEPLVLHLSGWRGTTSLRCYTTQHSTVHLLRLLGGDVSKYDVNKFKNKNTETDEMEQEKSEDIDGGKE